jgi:type II secretory pathway predicted ATPase ExeA
MCNLQPNRLDAPCTSHNDINLYFVSDNCKNLTSNILQAIKNQKNFVLITGEPGVGKTRFIDYLTNHLPPSVLPMVRKASEAEPLHLMPEVSMWLDLPASGDNILELHALKEKLQELHNQNQHPVLIIDDANKISMHNLSEIALLRSMEINNNKLLSIILVGHDEHFAECNIFNSIKSNQQYDIKLDLQPLSQSETIAYIDHYLRFYRSSFDSCFEPDCSDLIYHRTGGVPRSINQLCDEVLLAGMTGGLKKINRMNFAGIFELKQTACQFAQNNCGTGKATVLLGIGLVLLLGAGIIFYGIGGKRLQSLISSPLQSLAPAATKGTPNALRDKTWQVVTPNPPADEPSGAKAGIILSQQVSATPDMGGRGEFPISRPQEPIPQTTWEVRSNENLTKIVARYYRDHEQIGLEAVILANPDIRDEDYITPGQILSLPKIHHPTGEIELADQQLYALYGIYTSAASLANDLAWLAKRGIRYEVREIRGPNNVVLNHVFLGGYQKSQELQEARERVRTRAKGSRGQLPPPQ